ncbi:hypothetical protein Q8A73_012823 [Channa argus]|nr:hypothetical protein Q8A73_012823 [Channa argus]
MSVNSSISSNGSHLHSNFSTNSSLKPNTPVCFNYKSTFYIFTSFSVTNIILLLPLLFLVLCLGLQRWRKQLSASMVTTSHSDIFTYHMVAIEMISIFGCGLYCCGVWINVPVLIMLGLNFFHVTSNGEIFLHILTSVDRYMAVVHPITYMRLRNRNGVILRNVTLGFSVLHALIRPGPGEQSRAREQGDKSKMRAFHTIMAIMGVLLLRLGGHLFVTVIYSSALREDSAKTTVV